MSEFIECFKLLERLRNRRRIARRLKTYCHIERRVLDRRQSASGKRLAPSGAPPGLPHHERRVTSADRRKLAHA